MMKFQNFMWSDLRQFKAIITVLVLTLSLISCTTVGSTERVNFSVQASENISSEITRNIKEYPDTIYAPGGKPLFEAIADGLVNNGLDVRTSNKRTFFLARNNGFITIKTNMYNLSEALVIINSPYFKVSQLFDSENGTPTSKQSLLLKPLKNN